MDKQRTLAAAGCEIVLDADGYLLNPDDWSESVAEQMARLDGLELCAAQWWLIRFVRAHQARYGMPPLMRMAVAAMRRDAGLEDASSQTLYRLFPAGPIREACRYGGLPRPESCI